MKKAWAIRFLLLLIYGVPFAFLSVNGDATSGTMLYYGIMMFGFASLCFCSLKTNNIAVLFIGNVISFISSYSAAISSGTEAMGEYFKPFTAHSLIVWISVALIVVQTIIVLVHIRRQNAIK